MGAFVRSLLSARRSVVGSTLCGGAAIGLLASHAPAFNASDSSLGSMWAAAIDGMIDVPSSEDISTPTAYAGHKVLYMAPNPDAKPRAWPRIWRRSMVFSLTAHNPMGEDAPADVNRAMNDRLEKDLEELAKPEPRESHVAPRATGLAIFLLLPRLAIAAAL